jgi:colicin import membrane protein
VFRGLLTSFAGHAFLLAWALFSIQHTPELPEIIPIEATIITPSELTRLKQGDPQAKELEAKAKDEPQPEVSKNEAEKPKPIIDQPPPPEEPGPTPDEKKKLEEKLEQERAAEEQKKKAEEQKKADQKKAEEKKKADDKKKKLADAKRKADEAKKKQFDADRIAALIDKSPDKRGAPRSALAPTKPTDYTGPTMGERQGHDVVLSAREQDLLLSMINSQLKPCARLAGGGGGPDTPTVNVEFHLNQDGSLAGEPVITDRQNTPLYSIAADATVRAIKQCAPFQLPPDKYGAWSKVTLIFDWPAMLGLR